MKLIFHFLSEFDLVEHCSGNFVPAYCGKSRFCGVCRNPAIRRARKDDRSSMGCGYSGCVAGDFGVAFLV